MKVFTNASGTTQLLITEAPLYPDVLSCSWFSSDVCTHLIQVLEGCRIFYIYGRFLYILGMLALSCMANVAMPPLTIFLLLCVLDCWAGLTNTTPPWVALTNKPLLAHTCRDGKSQIRVLAR